MMKRVFLGGTTAGTMWRQELTVRLVQRGVRPDQIINPQLPPGVPYTHGHMLEEELHKNDRGTIIFILVCPAVVTDTSLSPEMTRLKREMLGPITMHEIGKYAYSQPQRTIVVLNFREFTEGGRARKVLEGLAREHHRDFRGRPPFAASQEVAENWLVERLVG